MPPESLTLDACAVYEDLVEAPGFVDFVQRTEDRQWLGRLLAGLPERSRRVLEGRFGHGWTLDRIGKRENLTQERVRQIERQALERMRQPCLGQSKFDTLDPEVEPWRSSNGSGIQGDMR